ncbi:MAG: branched-chain amino acid ABC transporter permease [Ilumatobacteraceae bacterium]
MPIVIKEGSPQHWGARLLASAAMFGVVYYFYLSAKPATLESITEATIIAIAAVALNLLLGYNGQISIGHSAFAGLASFTTGYTVSAWGWGPYKALLLSIVLCFIVGFLVGLPALRLKGPYLALVTLAVAFVWPTIAAQFLDKTVKDTKLAGLRLNPPEWSGLKANRQDRAIYLYWLGFVLLLVAYVVVRNLRKSRIGRSLVAVRDNETAAAVMGVNLRLTKTITFGVSAGITAMAGWLFAAKSSAMFETDFLILQAIIYLLALFLGGAATLTGPVVGAFAYYFVNRFVKENAGDWTFLPGPLKNEAVAPFLLSIIVIVFVFIAPFGLVGFFKTQGRRFFTIAPRPLRLAVAQELQEQPSPALAGEVE